MQKLNQVLVGLLVAGLGIAGCGESGSKSGGESGGESSGDSGRAEEQFFGALQNAARQQRLGVAMYRETFATRADAEARRNPGTITSSVSEVDTERGQFRSVFATNLLRQDGFTLGRCVDRTTYIDHYPQPAQRPKSLAQAVPRLKPAPGGNLFKVTQPLIFISCPHLGVMPGQAGISMSRLSDGVFPVTLSDQQAADWAAQVSAAKLFEVRDEGTVTKDGATLRKLGFAARPGESEVSRKLSEIFHRAGEIERITREHPNAETAYEFQSVNPLNSGGVGGYYLIDESRNLPVYSELSGTNPDRPNTSGTSGHNIARTKQSYSYPAALTMDANTPLTYLN